MEGGEGPTKNPNINKREGRDYYLELECNHLIPSFLEPRSYIKEFSVTRWNFSFSSISFFFAVRTVYNKE